MEEAGLKRAASLALRTAQALPIPWSRGGERSRSVINPRNTILFFVILFLVAIAMSFLSYVIAAGV